MVDETERICNCLRAECHSLARQRLGRLVHPVSSSPYLTPAARLSNVCFVIEGTTFRYPQKIPATNNVSNAHQNEVK
jgi:hypothetical protein